MRASTALLFALYLAMVVLSLWKLGDLVGAGYRALRPKRRQNSPWFPSESQGAIDRRLNRLRRAGICDACYGRGYYDNPPWGITPCDDCHGSGNLR